MELQPLTDADVTAYLDHLEAAGAQLGDLRSAITADEALRDLMRSPLMLQVVAIAYGGDLAHTLPRDGDTGSRGQRMWAAYVDQMLRGGHPPRKAVRQLAWLAAALQNRNQAEFHLDRLTAGWLPVRHRRWLVRRCIALARHTASDIRPSEELHLSWESLRTMLAVTLPLWLLGGLVLGLIGGGIVKGLSYGLEMGILFALNWTRTFGLTPALRDVRSTPNEGIRRSAINGLLIGLSAGLIAGLSSGLVFALIGGRFVGLAFGLFLGVAFSLTFGFTVGGKAFLQHCIVRGVLALSGCAPWRYKSFLDTMTKRLFLRRNGSGYRFVHQLLRDYLAKHDALVAPAEKGKAVR